MCVVRAQLKAFARITSIILLAQVVVVWIQLYQGVDKYYFAHFT